MDTLNAWLSLAVPTGGALGAVLLWRSSKRGQDKTSESGFRADLMKRIGELEEAQRKDALTIERLQSRNDALLETNRELREQVFALERRLEVVEKARNEGGKP